MPTPSSTKQADQTRTKRKTAKKPDIPVAAKRGRGRPAEPDAKHKNFAYRQATVLVPKVEYEEAKLILVRANLQKRESRSMSDLFSDLLVQWVQKHKRQK